MPERDQLAAQLVVVVDAAVEDDRQPERLVAHRLRATLAEVDDRQPPVDHADAVRPRGRTRPARAAASPRRSAPRVAIHPAVAPDLDAEAAHF